MISKGECNGIYCRIFIQLITCLRERLDNWVGAQLYAELLDDLDVLRSTGAKFLRTAMKLVVAHVRPLTKVLSISSYNRYSRRAMVLHARIQWMSGSWSSCPMSIPTYARLITR